MAKVSDDVVDFPNMSDEEKKNFVVECVNKICNVDKSSSVRDWSTDGKALYVPRSFINGFMNNLNKKKIVEKLSRKKTVMDVLDLIFSVEFYFFTTDDFKLMQFYYLMKKKRYSCELLFFFILRNLAPILEALFYFFIFFKFL